MRKKARNAARIAATMGLSAVLALGGTPILAVAAEPDDLGSSAAVGVQSGEEEGSDGSDAVVGEAETAGGNGAQADGSEPAGGVASASAADKAATAADAELAGKGTAEDPYQVGTVADLQKVAELVNGGDAAYAKAHYKLTDNVDLSGVESWTPIGTEGSQFTGTFTGTGFTISNLKINDADLEFAGLFGCVSAPGKLVGITVDNAVVTGKAQVGVIAGSVFTGAAEDCHVTGAVNVTGNYKVGGMFGDGYANLSGCTVNATGSVTGNYLARDLEGDCVGGLIGFRGEGDTITTDCSVSGIKVSGSRKVGGLIGSAYADNQTTDCSVSGVSLVCNAPYDYAEGSAKNQLCVGGLIGIFHKSGSNGGALSGCSVSNVSFDIEDPQVKQEGWPILGIVSGGYRASSISGASAPDGQVNVDGLTVSGENTGSNAEQKFPGSVAMNGTSSVFEQGSGTADDPYIISSVDDLKLFRETVNGTGLTYEGQYLKIADGAEFDLSGEQWTSIGTSSKKFMGAFDGNGAMIKGLTDGGKFGTYGLFGYISGATIKNMKFVDVKLEYNGSNRGAVAGCLYGTNTIENIEVSGSVAGNDYVGGIAGRPYLNASNPGTLTIKNCVNNATISGKAKVGGIAGYARADVAGSTLCVVEGCTNNGVVSGQYAGGIAGWSYNAELTSCANTAKVSGTTSAGGIVGSTNQNSRFESCKNAGEILQEGSSDSGTGAGGIVGVSNSGGIVVTKSANTGSVTGVKSAGGIIGGTQASGDSIDNCYNGGAIVATGDGAVAAGMFGYNNSSSPVKACLNDGVVTADKGTAYQIGLSNYWYEPAPGSQIASCYYLGEDGTIYAAAEDGKGEGTEQKDMTRGELAEVLNTAGGVDNFWQAQNGSVQPDPLVPGAWDDEGKAVVEILDAEGSLVDRYETFDAAVAAVVSGQTIKLVKNTTVAGKLNIDVAVELDLNGCILTGTNTVYSFGFKGNGASRVFDSSADKSGKIVNAASRALVIDGPGVQVVLDDVTIEAGLYVAQVSNAAQVTLRGGTYTGGDSAFAMYGTQNEADKDKPTTIIVEDDAVLTGGASYAVSSNGNAKYLGPVNIHVNGGELISKSSDGGAVYMPTHGEFVMTDGYLEGAQGVQICDGATVKISGGAIKATNPNTIDNPSKQGDGIVEDGAALSIVSRGGGYGVAGSATVEITGGTFEAAANPAIREYGFGDIAGSLVRDMSISGNAVVTNLKSGAPAVELALLEGDAAKVISGGTYSAPLDESYLAEGFGPNELPEGGYGVHEHKWADEVQFDESGHWKTCTLCNEATVVEPHELSAEWATDAESHWHACSGCGYTADKAAHQFSDWTVTKEATATEAGSREHTCATCGMTVSEVIPALGGGADQGSSDQQKPGSDQEKPALALTGDSLTAPVTLAGVAIAAAAVALVAFALRRRQSAR